MNIILPTVVILAVTFIHSGVGRPSDAKGLTDASMSSLPVSKVLQSRREPSDVVVHPRVDVEASPLMSESKPNCHSIFPCQVESKSSDYVTFVNRHVLTQCFDRHSHDAWER